MSDESSKMVSVRTAVRVGALTSVAMVTAFFAGVYVAHAVPGGETRPALSFAGTLRGATGQPLTFTFHKMGAADCTATTAAVTPDATTGAFSVEVPLSACPTLFDGGDVTFDVNVGATRIATAQRVNPVPYARYADQTGTPDCPATYTRDTTATGIILCRRGNDEVVRVGDGNSAFWIDRYEASVWAGRDGTGIQYGVDHDDYPSTFPKTGQWTTRLFAASRAGGRPSASLTWFQASEACRASGKRLPTGDEWLTAARGTVDPGDSDGTGGACRTSPPGGVFRTRDAGEGIRCVSAWGAQDMIGNVSEVTSEWYAGVGEATTSSAFFAFPSWPTMIGFPSDSTANIISATYSGYGPPVRGLPAAARRGGSGDYRGGLGTWAGLFSLSLLQAPSFWDSRDGLRCVIPR